MWKFDAFGNRSGWRFSWSPFLHPWEVFQRFYDAQRELPWSPPESRQLARHPSIVCIYRAHRHWLSLTFSLQAPQEMEPLQQQWLPKFRSERRRLWEFLGEHQGFQKRSKEWSSDDTVSLTYRQRCLRKQSKWNDQTLNIQREHPEAIELAGHHLALRESRGYSGPSRRRSAFLVSAWDYSSSGRPIRQGLWFSKLPQDKSLFRLAQHKRNCQKVYDLVRHEPLQNIQANPRLRTYIQAFRCRLSRLPYGGHVQKNVPLESWAWINDWKMRWIPSQRTLQFLPRGLAVV